MPTTTTNYGLAKPTVNEAVDITVINANADKLDTELKRVDNRLDQDVKTTSEVTFAKVTANLVVNAGWNDLAELYAKDKPGMFALPGMVIERAPDGTGYRYTTKAYSRNVVGVCSDTYGHLLGGEADNPEDNSENYVPVGISGRVTVYCMGRVKRGDLLVSSRVAGVARRVGWLRRLFLPAGVVIGKAVEDKTTAKAERVAMQIMLR